jgi:hypothetical protein
MKQPLQNCLAKISEWNWEEHLNSSQTNTHIVRILSLFTAVIFQVEVFGFLTPRSVGVGYQRFVGPYCLHLQGEVKYGPTKPW